MNKHFVAVVLPLAVLAAVVVGLAFFWPLELEQAVPRSSENWGWMRQEQFMVTATGAAGTARGSQGSDGPVRGHIYGVYLDFNMAISTTTDFTLGTTTSPTVTILSLSNYYTDTWQYPTVQLLDSSGVATGMYDWTPTNDFLTAVVAQSTVTDVVTVTVLWGE